MTGIVHTVIGTAANVNDVTQAHSLLHGEEELVLGDAGYQGVEKREENRCLSVRWHIAMRPGKRLALGRSNMGRMLESYERAKASLRARVEHAFRVIKRQFGFTKVRYRGLAGEEHGAIEDVVYAGELVEGSPSFDGDGRIGAPEIGEGGPKRAVRGENHPSFDQFLSLFSA